MAAITRLGLGGSSAAYHGFTPKAESAIRHNIGGRLRDVRVTPGDLDTVAIRSVDLYDVQGGD